jgi:hypothetical protein
MNEFKGVIKERNVFDIREWFVVNEGRFGGYL